MLFGLKPLDFRTFALVTMVLGVMRAISITGPAWRAAKIDPRQAQKQVAGPGGALVHSVLPQGAGTRHACTHYNSCTSCTFHSSRSVRIGSRREARAAGTAAANRHAATMTSRLVT
jgi:hypothetical protein